MQLRQYLIADFLEARDAFHFARTTLTDDVPSAAHSHDYFEVFLVESGTLAHWVNGEVQTLSPGTVVFVRPDDTHALYAVEGQTCQVINVLFRTETADHMARRYGPDLGPRFFWTEETQPAAYRLSPGKRDIALRHSLELQNAPRSLSRVEEYLLTLMARIIDMPEAAGAELPGWLVTACEQARSPEVFRQGAAGFVQAAGRGHEHVCRKTKEHLGVTPSAFVNRIRMQHAASLLADEDISVNDVADDCGIENMSHFYRVFRQHYGVTPKAFRKQHRLSPF